MSLLQILAETYNHEYTSTGSVVLTILYGCSHMEYSDVFRELVETLDLVSLVIASWISL